jgi:selenocysteine-specific elongation factor
LNQCETTLPKHLILGTAGHVDHGKTSLIKALTGINTDRLKEEQERGLTIDLGFAHLTLPNGDVVGIVDVPGHEKFLKNMLAGASGVDIGLLVVAADEGVMPQTREHLQILQLLDTRSGLIALTKCDMVDPELAELAEDELREYLKGTFLANAKIVRVSAVTGEGVTEVAEEIARLAMSVDARGSDGPFRLPVDRVFTMTGFGTVVTGTLVSGKLSVGDKVEILPQGLESRVRQIQTYGRKFESAVAGSRVAANLVGVELSDVERGSVVASPGFLKPSRNLGVSLVVLSEAARPLSNRSRVRVHVGTTEVLGRIVLFGIDQLGPGDRGYGQLRLESDVAVARGDRFVVRFYSPMRLLGGGVVLDPVAPVRRRTPEALAELRTRADSSTSADRVEEVLSGHLDGRSATEIALAGGLSDEAVVEALAGLVENGKVVEREGRVVSVAAYQRAVDRAVAMVSSYHTSNPAKAGMPREELRVGLGMGQKPFHSLLDIARDRGDLGVLAKTVSLTGYKPRFSEAQARLSSEILRRLELAGVNPPTVAELLGARGQETRAMLDILVDRDEVVKISPELVFHPSAIVEAEAKLRSYLAEHGSITVAEFRDLIGSSRKYVVPLIEYFDSKRVTRRVGDVRRLVEGS